MFYKLHILKHKLRWLDIEAGWNTRPCSLHDKSVSYGFVVLC